MKYSAPIRKILERELARIEGRRQDGPSRVVGEIGRLLSAVESLEAVALNCNPADTPAMHVKRTHDAGVRLARAVEATRVRSNEILNTHTGELSKKLLDRTGLRPPETLAEIMRQSEFRAVVRSLDSKARLEILSQAVKAKDTEVLGALFNASPLVTGFDPVVLARMRSSYEESVAPDVVAEIGALVEADGALQAVARSAEKVARDSQDERAMQAFIRAEQAATEANASFASAIEP